MKANSRAQAFLREPAASARRTRCTARGAAGGGAHAQNARHQETPERRSAGIEAERRRYQNVSSGNVGPMGGP
jgi:hypothetical protein